MSRTTGPQTERHRKKAKRASPTVRMMRALEKAPGYHGKEWWSFMEKLGLRPAPQGKNGKSRLQVFQTIQSDGAFAAAFNELLKDVRLPFVSLELAPRDEARQAGAV